MQVDTVPQGEERHPSQRPPRTGRAETPDVRTRPAREAGVCALLDTGLSADDVG